MSHRQLIQGGESLLFIPKCIWGLFYMCTLFYTVIWDIHLLTKHFKPHFFCDFYCQYRTC